MNDENSNKKDKIRFLKIKKKDAQYFIQIIKDRFKNDSIISQKYKIVHDEEFILFPLIQNREIIDKLVETIENLIKFELVSKKGIENPNFKYRTLEDALKGKIPTKYLSLIPKSYDIIGNIAILEFEKSVQTNNSKFIESKTLVAKAIIDVNKNVQSVFEKKGEITGSYRLRNLAFLGGENNTETVHKENDCIFHLDIKTTYFSPRLVFERRRISKNNIKEKEIIVDMFAGVGPFSIQVAKVNNVKIHAFDVNPYAYKYLKTNIDSNKLREKIIPYNMNSRDLLDPSNQIGKELKGNIDRIIMNLPETSLYFMDVACFLMKKSGGTLHFYFFSKKPNAVDFTINALKKKLNEFNWTIDKILDSKIVKSYSPKAELVVVDLFMKYFNS